jgi:hypothetical protein
MSDPPRVHARSGRDVFSRSLVLCALLALGAVDASGQPVRWVQNYGADQPGCGTQSAPCRSITHAVAAAPAGAIVFVGPGRYGDVNRNGSIDPGDETPLPRADALHGAIRLERPIRIYSTHGAEITTIDLSSNPAMPMAVVAIRANDVQFGRPGGGFRLIADNTGNGTGVTFPAGKSISNIRVSGNIIEGHPVDGYAGSGILAAGDHHSVLLTDNVVTGKGAGIVVSLGNSFGYAYGPATIERNTLRYNGMGASLGGRGITFTGNVMDSNASQGVSAQDVAGPPNDTAPPPGTGIAILDSYIVNNAFAGLLVGTVESFRRNVVVANGLGGIEFVSDWWVGSIAQNNIYGNGVQPAPGLDTSNCGVILIARIAPDITNNYWGAATGPGPDPADDSAADGTTHCVGLDGPGPGSIDTPFATAPFEVPIPFHPGAPRG